MYNGFQNPFMPSYATLAQNYNVTQPVQVVRVNGRNGAEAYAIGPNSSALLLDESGRIVWAVTTDGAGYKTITPYDILPHQDTPAPDYSGLESRIARLEGMMDEYTASNTSTTRKRKPDATGSTTD